MNKTELQASRCIHHKQLCTDIFERYDTKKGDVYGLFCNCTEELGEARTLHGQIFHDKMKLKSGFYANVKDGTTTAMAASSGRSTLSLAEELQQLVEREESEAASDDPFNDDSTGTSKSYTDAMYVNIFQLKTSNGLAHYAKYFYNDGSLLSDEQLGNLLLVITMYEIIDTHIHATNCDASGQNGGTVNSPQQ